MSASGDDKGTAIKDALKPTEEGPDSQDVFVEGVSVEISIGTLDKQLLGTSHPSSAPTSRSAVWSKSRQIETALWNSRKHIQINEA